MRQWLAIGYKKYVVIYCSILNHSSFPPSRYQLFFPFVAAAATSPIRKFFFFHSTIQKFLISYIRQDVRKRKNSVICDKGIDFASISLMLIISLTYMKYIFLWIDVCVCVHAFDWEDVMWGEKRWKMNDVDGKICIEIDSNYGLNVSLLVLMYWLRLWVCCFEKSLQNDGIFWINL